MMEKVIFLDLPEEQWSAIMEIAETEAGLARFMASAAEEKLAGIAPFLARGTAAAAEPITPERLQQVGQGMDKNNLVMAFVKEDGRSGARLYVKRDGQTVATFAHVLLGLGPKRGVWDIRAEPQDFIEMIKAACKEQPGLRQALQMALRQQQ